MRRLLAHILLLLLLGISARGAPTLAGGPGFAAGHVLVRYAPGRAPPPGDRDALLPQLEHTPSEIRPAPVLPGESVEAAVARLAADDAVLYAEPDFVLSTDLAVAPGPRKEGSRKARAAQKYPNDFMYPSQWALKKVSASKAWGITTGSSDVRVCLLDSGVQYTHEDLAQNVEFGYDVVAGIPDAWDPSDHGHGTMMAGQIAASTNQYRGIAALPWKVTLLPCKFIDEGGVGLNSEAIECMYWCRNQNASILSFSFGGPYFSQAMHDAMAEVAAGGALLVVAACNAGADNDLGAASNGTCWPAAQRDIPGQITVTATDTADALPPFASWGAGSVHLAAPGVNVMSTGTENSYQYGTGTSIAVPQVAAAAALVKSAAPHLNGAQIKEVLMANADHPPALAGRVAGGGRLNAYKAVRAVAPKPQLSPKPPKPKPKPKPKASPKPLSSPSLRPKALTCSAATLAAGAAATCDCSFEPADLAAGSVSVAVSVDWDAVPFKQAAAVETAAYSFGATPASQINLEATLTDDRAVPPLSKKLVASEVTSGWSTSIPDAHLCSPAKSAYDATSLTYTETVTNVTVLKNAKGESLASSTASTAVTCRTAELLLLKTLSGGVSTAQTWSFLMVEGVYDVNAASAAATTLAATNAAGFISAFAGATAALRTDKKYTVCEAMQAGWGNEWKWKRDATESSMTPFFPANSDVRCVEVGAGTSFPLSPGASHTVAVNNVPTGGIPLSPGYWSQWNRCTGGKQPETAAKNGGCAAGFCLVEDLLAKSPITWDAIQSDALNVSIDTCVKAVNALQGRQWSAGLGGKVLMSDPARKLARAVLAAQLNLAAGACAPANVVSAVQAGLLLLDQANFKGTDAGAYITKTVPSATAMNQANQLAALLDAYNNHNCSPV